MKSIGQSSPSIGAKSVGSDSVQVEMKSIRQSSPSTGAKSEESQHKIGKNSEVSDSAQVEMKSIRQSSVSSVLHADLEGQGDHRAEQCVGDEVDDQELEQEKTFVDDKCTYCRAKVTRTHHARHLSTCPVIKSKIQLEVSLEEVRTCQYFIRRL